MSFPLRKIPGLAWPAIPPGEACQRWGLYLELERTQWRPADEIVAGQLAQVRGLLAHCSAHVPYYRELLRTARIKPADIRTMDDFRRIPILLRRTYHAEFPRFQATALPAGLTITKKTSTSGTGGIPIVVWQTNLVNLWWRACYLRDLHWSAIDVRGSLASIRFHGVAASDNRQPNPGFVRPTWNDELAQIVETGPAFALDITHEPRRQLEWLLSVQPNYLLSMPSNVVFLARLLAESGQRIPSLRAIQLIGESLTEDDQTRIETAFGVPARNLYSCMEAGYLASPCPDGHGLHVHAENVLLEVINDAGQPCAAGETGRVVITTLRNHATPFLRYEILDHATVGPAQCPCGRGLPLLIRVQGKVRPLFILPGGRYQGSPRLTHGLFKLNIYHQHQIVQRAIDHFVIRVVPNGRWNDGSVQQIRHCVQEYLEAPVRVDVETVSRIETTTTGKLLDVIVEVPQLDARARAT